MKAIHLIILFTLFVGSLFAQAPQAFNYQGVARDLSGNPLPNQDIQLRITVKLGDVAGTDAYQEIHQATTSDLGLFNLQVGMGTPTIGDFSGISWGSNRHYLQIEMDEEGGNDFDLLGTSELLSVPYALYAENGGGQFEEVDSTYVTQGGSEYTLRGLQFSEGLSSISLYQVEEPRLFHDFFPQIKFVDISPTWGRSAYNISLITREEYNNVPTLEFMAGIPQGQTRHFAFRTAGTAKLFIQGNGNIGLSTSEPASRLQVADGDIYIEDVNRGVIMRSPNGQCWRMTVNNAGQPEMTAIACPE
ncbi:hypothetical protein [Lewinella sp. W8]|uniref:hypothetical protein n=1 Tax=Lewinella sp. W8 TaxID=2528208 RepID=UPI001068BCEB|nr:hypothetical protein [Lewinella sp. W8]MTB53180.1 hypothetical protein [Lewinella sp. W8]